MITERKELMMKIDDMVRLRRKKLKYRVFFYVSFFRVVFKIVCSYVRVFLRFLKKKNSMFIFL